MTDQTMPRQRQTNACALAGIAQFAELPEPVRAELSGFCRLLHYRAGQTVAPAEEPMEMIGFLRSGLLRMQKTLLDGRQHVVGLLVPGDMFGRVFDGPSHFAIEAAADSTVLAFGRGPFEALLQRSAELDRLLMLNFLNELDRARDWMVVLAHPKVRGRIAGFLVMLCTRYAAVAGLVTTPRGLQVRVPIGRTDLAHLLGARPESISRALHALADEGLIELLRPDLFEIRDMERLAAEAGEPDLGAPSPLETLLHPARRSGS